MFVVGKKKKVCTDSVAVFFPDDEDGLPDPGTNLFFCFNLIRPFFVVHLT